MELQMFAVYDSAAEAFMTPFFTHNTGIAMRSFGDQVNNPETMFFRHPGDYSLFQLGSWEDQRSDFKPLSTPVRVASALELKAQSQSMELFNDEIGNDSQLPGRPQSGDTQE